MAVKKLKWCAMGVWWGVRWAPGTSWAFLLSLMHLIPGNVRKNRPGPWSAWIPLLIWGSAELMRQVQHPAHQSDPSICPHCQHHYDHGHQQQRHHHHHGHQHKVCKSLILSPNPNQSRSSWNAEEQWDSRLHRTPIQPIKNQHNQHMWEHPIHQESA